MFDNGREDALALASQMQPIAEFLCAKPSLGEIGRCTLAIGRTQDMQKIDKRLEKQS